MSLLNPWELIPKVNIKAPTIESAKALPKLAKVPPLVTRKATGLLGRFIPSPVKEVIPKAQQEEKFRAGLEEPAKKVGEFFARPVVAAAQAIMSRPETFKAMLTEPNKLMALKTILTEKPKDVAPIQNKYLGEEPVTGLKESKVVGGISKLLSKFTSKVGISEETTRRGVEATALPLLALFADPGLGSVGSKATKKLLEEGAAKLGKETLGKILKEEGAAGVERALKNVVEGVAGKVTGRNVIKRGVIESPFQEALPRETQNILKEVPTVPTEVKTVESLVPEAKLGEEVAVAGEKELVDKAGNIRMDKIAAPEDVKEVIRATAKASAPEIETATRGVVKQAETRRMAEQLGMTYDTILERKVGEAYNAEQMKAASDLMVRSADDVVKAETKYVESGMDEDLVDYMLTLNKHSMIQASVSGAKAEIGRALAIQKLTSQATKKQDLINNLFELMGGKEITEKIAKQLADAARIAKETGDYRAYYGLIRQFNKPSFGEKTYEFWLNSILSGIKTHVVNTTSNLYKAVTGVADRYAQALIELPLGSKKTVTFSEANQYAMGSIKGLTDGVARALKIIKYGPEPETLGKLDIRKLPAIGGMFGEVVRTPTKLLAAEDEFFKAISGTAEMYAQAYRTAYKEGKRGQSVLARAEELMLNPTEGMMKMVKQTELEATFQQDLGRMGKSIMTLRNTWPGVKYIIPFIKTPTNIFKTALKGSPLGFLETAAKIYKGAPTQEITKSAAQATVGSVIAAGLMLGYQQGIITGQRPSDPTKGEAFDRAGKLPTSIKIGDRYFSVARLEPLATIWNGIAGVAEMIDSGQDPSSAIASLTGIMVDQMGDKTFMQGLSEIFSVISARSPEERNYYIKRVIQNGITGFVPNVIAAPVQAIDPNVRDVRSDSIPDQMLNAIMVKLPWVNQLVPEKLDVFGYPIKKSGSILERMISPISTNVEKNDPLELEMDRLDVTLSQVDRGKTVGGVHGKLSYDMLRSFIKDEGQIGKALLTKMISLPGYQNMNDEDKANAIKTIMSDVRKMITEERTGELLLNVVGIDSKLDNQATVDQFNAAYKEIIATDEWKNLPPEEKIRMVIEDYSNMILKNAGADPRKREEVKESVQKADERQKETIDKKFDKIDVIWGTQENGKPTIAERHNNPGNLVYANQTGAKKGEYKGDGVYWARFKTPQKGLEALYKQIKLEQDRDLTLSEMMHKYAPSFENDTTGYIEKLVAETGYKPSDSTRGMNTEILTQLIVKFDSGTKIKF